MPVTEFNIMAEDTWGPRVDPSGTVNYRVTLEAFTDNPNDTGPQVVGAPGMPVKFGSHADDENAFCVSVDAKQHEDDATYWILTYDYTTRPEQLAQVAIDNAGGLTGEGEEDPQHNDADPLDRRPKIKLRTRKIKRMRFADLDGRPIQNFAGVPFAAHMEEVTRLVIDVTRNVPNFDPAMVTNCTDGVNEVPWLGLAKRQIWCADLTADVDREKQITFFAVHCELVIGKPSDILNDVPANGGLVDGYWAEWKLNAGYDEIDMATGRLKAIKIDGQRPAQPVLLNLFGGKLAAGQNPIFLGFRVKEDAPLHALGLFD